jgi:TetR/AcrR family transcriptional repressor of nem operon
MTRPKLFDEASSVDGAMRLFWKQGFDGAPLPDLLEAMGLSRGSFYNAFGGKQKILLEAIRRYMDSGMDGVLLPLFRPDAARKEIEEAFSRMIAHTASAEGRHGCLVNNCMTEVAARDPVARRALVAARTMVEDGFTRAVERGQADGTIARRDNPRSIGRFLLNNFSGLNVASKGRPGRAVLADIARVTLKVLD